MQNGTPKNTLKIADNNTDKSDQGRRVTVAAAFRSQQNKQIMESITIKKQHN
uniref:Uncharacterized protein n=1 Tax=Arion vulgaris TaxID=1028688 RepID=A0A0B6YC89_9EUPU